MRELSKYQEKTPIRKKLNFNFNKRVKPTQAGRSLEVTLTAPKSEPDLESYTIFFDEASFYSATLIFKET